MTKCKLTARTQEELAPLLLQKIIKLSISLSICLLVNVTKFSVLHVEQISVGVA